MEINIIPKFLDEALTPIAKESGERLADIVSLVFTPIIKAKAIRDKNLEIFLKELDAEVKKNPENKIQEPPLYIVGPALEDVIKYYCDEKYLRSMFAKLIASSMNVESNIHPSYIETIKQLSNYDLAVLRHLFILIKEGEFAMKWVLLLYYPQKDKDWRHATEILIINKHKYKKIKLNKILVSLYNLQRLSLISIKNRPDLSRNIEENDIESNGIVFEYENFLVDIESCKKSEINNRIEYDKENQYLCFAVTGTAYLLEFMKICCSEELYRDIDEDAIFM